MIKIRNRLRGNGCEDMQGYFQVDMFVIQESKDVVDKEGFSMLYVVQFGKDFLFSLGLFRDYIKRIFCVYLMFIGLVELVYFYVFYFEFLVFYSKVFQCYDNFFRQKLKLWVILCRNISYFDCQNKDRLGVVVVFFII